MSKKKNRPEPESLELPRVGVESHAHLDLDDFDADRETLLERAAASGIAHIGNVFLGVDAYLAHRCYFADHPEVFFLLGVHPNETGQLTDQELDRMRACFRNDPRLKGVGEIGLDYYWDRVPPAVQQAAFGKQLDLARELGRPVIIHSRDADPDTLAMLEGRGFRDYPVLWHCFGGGPDLARTVLDNGWFLSIPGPVTYKANDELRMALSVIPLDRMMIETDCPYLTPEPWRGKRNHPALVAFTAQRIGQAIGRSTEDVWRETGDTARKFFGLE